MKDCWLWLSKMNHLRFNLHHLLRFTPVTKPLLSWTLTQVSPLLGRSVMKMKSWRQPLKAAILIWVLMHNEWGGGGGVVTRFDLIEPPGTKGCLNWKTRRKGWEEEVVKQICSRRVERRQRRCSSMYDLLINRFTLLHPTASKNCADGTVHPCGTQLPELLTWRLKLFC